VARTIAGEGREESGPFSEKYVDSLNTTDGSDGSILTEKLRPALFLVEGVLIIAGMCRIALESCGSFDKIEINSRQALVGRKVEYSSQ